MLIERRTVSSCANCLNKLQSFFDTKFQEMG